jgi:hypothetical protein
LILILFFVKDFLRETSKTVGEIAFIVNGQKIAWGGIPDPTGLKNFIKSIKKTMYDHYQS